MIRMLITAALSWSLAFVAPAIAAPATPEKLLAALDAASRAGDRDALDALITDDFRYALPGPGERLITSIARRKPAVTAVGRRVERRRAALTVRLDDRAGVLLARHEADGWRIDGWVFTAEAASSYLAGTPLRPPFDERLLLAGGALSDAIARGDTDAARGWMTPAFYEARRDGGGDLIAQCVRKGLKLLPREARAVGTIGSLTADIEREGRVVDRVWLLARLQPEGRWLFEAVTEDRERVLATLAKRIEPRFEPRRLPSEPGAAALVEVFRGALAAGDAAAALALLGPEPDRTPGIGQPRARRFINDAASAKRIVSPAAVHVDREQGRGAARLSVRMGRDEKGLSDQRVWLYLDRIDGRWVIVDLNFGLTADWFYRAPAAIPPVP